MAILIQPFPHPRWWECDTTSPGPGGPVPTVGHGNCNHTVYMLTCRQYDRLLARAGGYCETCGLPDVKNRFGRLYIDHDRKVGKWAVRGLLCLKCNASLHLQPTYERYIANSFFKSLLAESGLASPHLPEPEMGAVVLDHASRPWRSEEGGWWPRHQRSLPPTPETWSRLLYVSGPHNLRLFQGAAA